MPQKTEKKNSSQNMKSNQRNEQEKEIQAPQERSSKVLLHQNIPHSRKANSINQQQQQQRQSRMYFTSFGSNFFLSLPSSATRTLDSRNPNFRALQQTDRQPASRACALDDDDHWVIAVALQKLFCVNDSLTDFQAFWYTSRDWRSRSDARRRSHAGERTSWICCRENHSWRPGPRGRGGVLRR